MTETTTTKLVAKNNVTPVWCPGCGDFGVLQALVRTLQELGKSPRETVLVSGIGCSGRLPYFVDAYGFHSLHGRALPAALGIKLSNPALTVVVIGGDGDGFGIGGGHVPHIARRNVDLTYLILDNEVYALTKGHSSPTTGVGHKTPSARAGETVRPLDIVGMLLMYGTSFVATTTSGNRPRLSAILKDAIEHPGFAAVHIKSPCPTYNKIMTNDFLRDSLEMVPESHSVTDRGAAINLHLSRAGQWDGILYREPPQQMHRLEYPQPVEPDGRLRKLVERYV